MRDRTRRFTLQPFRTLSPDPLGLSGAVIGCSCPTQRRQGRQGPGKEKDVPPPTFTMPDAWAERVHLALHRPGQHGRPHHRRSPSYEADPSTYWVATASGGLLKTTNNGSHLRAPVRPGSDRVHRRRVRGPVGPQHRLGRHGREQPAQLRLLRRRRLQVHRRRQDLEEHGPEEDASRSARSSFIRRTRTSSTSAPWAGCTARTRNAASSRRPTAARPGTRSFYVDDKTGVIDMRMHPTNPDTLFVAMWERRRDEFDSWPGGGLPDGYDAYDPVQQVGHRRGHLQDHRRRQDLREG